MASSLCSSSSSFLLLFFLIFLSAKVSTTAGQEHSKDMIRLHFYMHEILSGPNATIAMVVSSPINGSSNFGAIIVADDPLTEGPEESSKLIGRLQQLVVPTQLDALALLTQINLVFTEGSEYNGSTLAVFGRFGPDAVNERSIVGGSGAFRMARGYVLTTPLSAPAGTILLELNAFVYV